MGIINYFTKLYSEHRALMLISWGYLSISAVTLLLAGIFALIDQNLGQSLLFVPFISFLICASNVVIWALIKLVIDTLTNKSQPAKSEKKVKA